MDCIVRSSGVAGNGYRMQHGHHCQEDVGTATKTEYWRNRSEEYKAYRVTANVALMAEAHLVSNTAGVRTVLINFTINFVRNLTQHQCNQRLLQLSAKCSSSMQGN